ncbi:hypothetical protein ACLOJK_019269, partial [Asimina triloba]
MACLPLVAASGEPITIVAGTEWENCLTCLARFASPASARESVIVPAIRPPQPTYHPPQPTFRSPQPTASLPATRPLASSTIVLPLQRPASSSPHPLAMADWSQQGSLPPCCLLAFVPANAVDGHAPLPTTAFICCNGIDGGMIAKKKTLGSPLLTSGR